MKKPLNTLLRQIVAIIVAFLFSLLIRWSFVSSGSAEVLSPLVVDAIDSYLPIVIPALVGVIHHYYILIVKERVMDISRRMPPKATEAEIIDAAFNADPKGKKRKAAKLLGGI